MTEDIPYRYRTAMPKGDKVIAYMTAKAEGAIGDGVIVWEKGDPDYNEAMRYAKMNDAKIEQMLRAAGAT